MRKDHRFLTELLGRMTLAEKVGQLSLYTADVKLEGVDTVNPALSFRAPEARFDAVRAGRVSGFFNGYGEAYVRALQRLAVEESRLGIPLIFGADVIHGFRTAFPVPLAEAASFEPELARRTARSAAAEAAAEGLHWTFSPGADLCRDARWGRVVESYGEDPLLAGRFAAARVGGYQGDDLAEPTRIMATIKHFAAYGAAEAGLDYNTAEISRATLVDCYLPPYRAGVAAGAGAVMSAFNDVEGVPASASRALLTTTLREAWGFEGFVVSDYNSDAEVITHGLAGDRREAARLCFLAGLDMCMQSGLYAEELEGLVVDGLVSEADVDRAVLRVLGAKQALGLFEDPYRGLGRAFDAGSARALAREAAGRCPVLLKNEGGVLPLGRGLRVTLIGPFAADRKNLNGSWAIFAANGESVNLEEGLRAALGDGLVAVEAGCRVDQPLEGGLERAAAAAGDADIVLLAVGEAQSMSGESRSRADITLPEAQLALVRAVKAAGKPVVTLLRTGRPLVIPELADLSDALLVTWFLGAETGHAVADLVTGRAAPSGRLPMSFPRAVGQVPIYYARKATGRPAGPRGTPFTARYIDVDPTPLFPFGFGLGYGAVAYGPTRASVQGAGPDAEIVVSCDLVEIGGADMEEAPQLYVRDLAASRVRPVRELKDFRKLAMTAGASATVSFTLRAADLGFADLDGDGWLVEPGEFEAWIAPHAEAGVSARLVLEGVRP